MCVTETNITSYSQLKEKKTETNKKKFVYIYCSYFLEEFKRRKIYLCTISIPDTIFRIKKILVEQNLKKLKLHKCLDLLENKNSYLLKGSEP